MPVQTLPWSASVLTVALLSAVACRELPTVSSEPVAPSLKPGAGTSYAILTPPAAPGWTPFIPNDLNAMHEVIGFMNPEGATGQGSRRAARWVAGGTAVPQVLPVLPGATSSQASDISDNGIIAGRIYPTAVLWQPAETGWNIVSLDDEGMAHGVRTDGAAVGTIWNPDDPTGGPPQPVFWGPDGTPTLLPLPPSGRWNGGEAFAINRDGDIAGSFVEWTLGHSYHYGALWIRDGAGWIPQVMQTGWARGLSDRTAEGRIYVTASGVRDAYRHRFFNTSLGWSNDSVYVGGSAEDMNASGDFVGTIQKSWMSAGSPFRYTASGDLLKLPLPRGSAGGANGISNDGWITGSIDGAGVVWRP